MQTPNDHAGHVTELIMARVKRRLPETDTKTYNAIYEETYAALDAFLDQLAEGLCDSCHGNGWILDVKTRGMGCCPECGGKGVKG